MSLGFDTESNYSFRPLKTVPFDGWPAAERPTDEERRMVLRAVDQCPEAMQSPVFIREECRHQRLDVSDAVIRGVLEGL